MDKPGCIKWVVMAFLTAILFYGCSTDFDLTTDWQDIPVVYGLIDANDSVHYVRIQKAYLLEGNALDAALINDSIYYKDSLNVVLKAVSGASSIQGRLVNAADIGVAKDPGVFSNDPHFLYEFKGNLNKTELYQLDITNTSTGKLTTSQTGLVDEFIVFFPKPGFPINLASLTKLGFLWTAPTNGAIYDLVLRFHYQEWDVGNPGVVEEKYIDWPVFTGENFDVSAGDRIEYEVDGKVFYNYISSRLETNSSLRRRFDRTKGVELRYFVGGDALYNYIRSRRAQNSLASNQATTTYSNINGGVGIFSSQLLQVSDSIQLNPEAIDSLACGSKTRALNFMNSSGDFNCD